MAVKTNEQEALAKRYGWQYYGQARPDFALEPEDGQESVWDYPRPPDVRAETRVARVVSNGQVIARTSEALRLCETASPPTLYLPERDIDMSKLLPVAGSSHCEWKGRAEYFALRSNPDVPVAWRYPAPHERYAALAGHLSFYPAAVSCFLDDESVRAQGGGFYGGWVTHDIVGPFKGESGTGGW